MGQRPWVSVSHSTFLTTTLIVLLLVPAATSQAPTLKPKSYVLGPFNESYINNDILNIKSTASISFGALQITPDSAGSHSDLTNNAGGVFFKEPFLLWEDNSTGRVASFNTSFLFNVFRVFNSTPGEGLAFVISPSKLVPPSNSGQYLGLTNEYSDGDPDNQIVAIEFDTVKQDFDPDDNHIGLDINSVKSKVAVSLYQFGFQIAPNGTEFFVVWIEYDGGRKVIDVYMAKLSDQDDPIVAKPNRPVLTSDLDLKKFVNQRSYIGFTASTGNNSQLNCILRWNLSLGVSSSTFEETTFEEKNGKLLKIGLGVGLPLLFVFFTALLYFLCSSKVTSDSGSDKQLLIMLKKLPGTPREFKFRDLNKATDNFNHNLKLGQGGFGVVYRGTLLEDNLQVAVKKFSKDKTRSTDNFLAELTIINRLRHKNLVPLLGWCHKNGVLLLVYEYMPNGSLDKHIFCEQGTSTTPLCWQLRYKIISGVASALHYLHNEYVQKVVHRDLKASNIMLDSDFNARLGDFGLARALENEKTSYAEMEGVAGTLGYIAPECLHTGKATCESDVYAFGIVLLEVVCGQRPWTKIEGYQFLVDWVWHMHREGRIMEAVDPRLGNEYVAEEARGVLKLGLACCHPIASERPKLQTIIQIISGSMPVPHVPPFKPAFLWPAAVDAGSLACEPTTVATIDYTPMNTRFFAR